MELSVQSCGQQSSLATVGSAISRTTHDPLLGCSQISTYFPQCNG